MLPADAQAVWAILLAVVPGFLATWVWSRAKTWRGPASDLRTILYSLALSALIQVVLAPLTVAWIYPIRDNLAGHPWRVAAWAALVVLVVPIGGGILAGRLSDWVFDARSAAVTGRVKRFLTGLLPAAPPPSIWDWLFTGNAPHGRFLVLEYRDGRRVAGAFAEGSLALTSPEPHGLFLVREWLLDDFGNLTEEVSGTGGVTILDTDNIRSIRILRPGR